MRKKKCFLAQLITFKGTVKWQRRGVVSGTLSIDRPLNPIHFHRTGSCHWRWKFDPGATQVFFLNTVVQYTHNLWNQTWSAKIRKTGCYYVRTGWGGGGGGEIYQTHFLQISANAAGYFFLCFTAIVQYNDISSDQQAVYQRSKHQRAVDQRLSTSTKSKMWLKCRAVDL